MDLPVGAVIQKEIVVRWSTILDCFDVAGGFSADKLDYRLTNEMMNRLFRDLHTMRLISTNMVEPCNILLLVTGLFSVLVFLFYLISGLITIHNNYEVKTTSDYRYIMMTGYQDRFLETILLPMVIVVTGVIGTCCSNEVANQRTLTRSKARLKLMQRIIARHQMSTFAGTNCRILLSSADSNQIWFQVYNIPAQNIAVDL